MFNVPLTNVDPREAALGAPRRVWKGSVLGMQLPLLVLWENPVPWDWHRRGRGQRDEESVPQSLCSGFLSAEHPGGRDEPALPVEVGVEREGGWC